MTDIIQDAKQLLGGATPGKWRAADSDIIAKDGNRFIATVSEYSGLDKPSEEYANVQLIAAAPELAQALAEETWEYSYHVQNTIGMWEHPTPWAGETGKWWETKEDAEESALAAHEYGYPIRIVRRRVSPVEVINE